MTLNKLILLTLPGLAFHLSNAQETKKKKVCNSYSCEEYYVLKSDKNIREGKYIKYYTVNIGGPYVYELGTYTNGLKSGLWMEFYPTYKNSLAAIFSYDQGNKNGPCQRFHPVTLDYLSMKAFGVTNLRAATTLMGIKGANMVRGDNGDFQVTFDTTGLKPMYSGAYSNDEPFGVWNFYSSSKKLLQRYDYSMKKLLVNYQDTSRNNLIYLGGKERFTSDFKEKVFSERLNDVEDRTTTYRVDQFGNYEVYKTEGATSLNSATSKILKMMPNAWLVIDTKKPAQKLVVIRYRKDTDFYEIDFGDLK